MSDLELEREALTNRLTRHIEVICATAHDGPYRIVNGTASDVATEIVRRWKDPVVRIALALSKLSEQTGKTSIARALKMKRRTVDSVWRDTLVNARILVHVGRSTEPEPKPIFRLGHERKQSRDGIRLVLRKEQLPFEQLQRIYESNRPVVASATEHEAAIQTEIAAHPEKGAFEREAAKKAAEAATQRGQIALLKTGTDAE